MFRVLVDPSQELVVAVLCWESMSSRMTHGNWAESRMDKVFKISGSDVKIGSSNYDALGQS